MHTWSLADVLDVLKHVEKLTRPPRRHEPVPSPHCDCGLADDMGDLDQHSCVCTIWDDTPNPTEPGLTDDELVGVRGLLQERYGECDSEPYPKRDTTSASVKSAPGTGAEPTSPAAPSTAGDSGEAVSGHSPRPDPASPRSPWSDLADRMVNHLPSAKAAQFDDAAAEWIGGAVPVIRAVLAEHRFYIERGADPFTYTYHCATPLGCLHERFDSRGYPGACDEWTAHVAPLIANALAPQPKTAFPEIGGSHD